MKNFEFLFWAYNAFWLILAGYIGYLLIRIRGAERELKRLEGRLEDGPAGR